ncbi:MAG: rRNA maturation RNase YbeY [Rhizobiales bacterium NRL2]|jgi:probable rRNA maturation factor|nr:MAG: rRNA maturation RNase YbeY [Rhizobiales bacterium NRL2]
MGVAPAANHDAALATDIVTDSGDWPDVAGLIGRAAAAAWAAAGDGGRAEVAVALMDDAAIGRLNAEFRGRDGPTNVLSFPAEDDLVAGHDGMLGDIALALETARREAGLEEKTFEDHLCHLVVHGMLHLLGHDHQTPGEAELMEDMERRILSSLGIADPYAGQQLDGQEQ